MRRALCLGLGLVAALAVHPLHARAGSVLDQVRKDGVLHCGTAIRPGLAFPDADHIWHGMNIDICRAVAAAVIGPNAPVDVQSYVLGKQFDRARKDDELSFLTTSEIEANDLFGAVLPGPTVFYETTHLLVPDNSTVHHVSDIAGKMVCAEPGTPAERNLRSYVAAHGIAISFSPWQEVEEMMDAFAVGRCPIVADELTAIAALRLAQEADGHPTRIVPEPLDVAPVMATTPFGDSQWSAIVAWTVGTLINAGNSNTLGSDALKAAGVALGLDAKWQDRALAATGGGYSVMFRNSLGSDSPLELPMGVNAPWDAGGLIVPQLVE